MSELLVARRYARAFLDTAQAAQVATVVLDEMEGFAALLEGSRELREVFGNPSFTAVARGKVLGELLLKTKTSPLSKQLLGYLLAKGRLLVLREICDAYKAQLDALSGRRQAVVMSAVPLDADAMGRIGDKLSGLGGGPVELAQKVSPELIGGLVVKMGGTVYDGSLRCQLDKLKQALTRG